MLKKERVDDQQFVLILLENDVFKLLLKILIDIANIKTNPTRKNKNR